MSWSIRPGNRHSGQASQVAPPEGAAQAGLRARGRCHSQTTERDKGEELPVPDISLLEPVVLRGVVEKFVTPQTHVMLNRLDQTPWPFPSATWDVIKGSRAVAKPN